jgi:tyrosine-protein kinase Etk/Wzc
LTATDGQGFSLLNETLGIRLDGTAGTPARAASRYGDVGILVARNDAAPGTRFLLRRVSAVQATEELQHALVVSENAKQSNVIKLALQGANPQLMSRILAEIVNEYMRQRGAGQLDDAVQLAASYDRQLDESKAALRSLDDQVAGLQRRSGIGDPESEGQALLQQSSALEQQLATAQQRKAELSSNFGDGHPAIEAVNQQIADAKRSLNRLAARRESVAVAGRELAKVRRDRQVLEEGRLVLFNQRSKLEALIAAERNDVRLLDQPEAPLHALTPSVPTMVLLSCFGGIALSLFASFIKNLVVQYRRSRLLPRRETRFRLISLGRSESSGAS